MGIFSRFFSPTTPTQPEPVVQPSAAEVQALGFDFLAIDFETARMKMDSACSVGIACVRSLEIVDTAYSLIRPPECLFDPKNVEIHGITPDMVENAPTLDEFWPQISWMFSTHCPVVAHNVHFDMSVLRLSMTGNIPNFPYLDTISMAAPLVAGSHTLDHCAQVLGIDMGHYHNALDDAVTCAQIAIRALKEARCTSMWEYTARRDVPVHDFADLHPKDYTGRGPKKPKNVETVKVSSIRPSESAEMDSAHPLYQKSIVFTGQLSMDRQEAMQRAADVGAVVRSSVSKRTDFLVVGKQDKALVGDDGMSGKEEKAAALNSSGAGHITVLTEAEFLALLDRKKVPV